MKRFLTLFIAVLCASAALQAQINTPQPSPTAEFKQKVGLTDITLNYSRPGVKGRTIFSDNGLVPYGKMWRTGANNATTIEFSEDVVFGGKDVPKGKYALYTIPAASSWTVTLYKDLELGGDVDNYDATKEVVRVTSPSTKMDVTIETFTIDIGDITDNSAVLGFLWESTWVPVEIKVHTDKQVNTQIDNFAKSPMSQIASNYLNAGWYYYNKGEKLDVAADFMRKGVEYSTSPFKFFWMNRAAEVIAKTGDKKAAIAMAKAAHQHGMSVTDPDAKGFYEATVKAQLDENIKKWSM